MRMCCGKGCESNWFSFLLFWVCHQVYSWAVGEGQSGVSWPQALSQKQPFLKLLVFFIWIVYTCLRYKIQKVWKGVRSLLPTPRPPLRPAGPSSPEAPLSPLPCVSFQGQPFVHFHKKAALYTGCSHLAFKKIYQYFLMLLPYQCIWGLPHYSSSLFFYFKNFSTIKKVARTGKWKATFQNLDSLIINICHICLSVSSLFSELPKSQYFSPKYFSQYLPRTCCYIPTIQWSHSGNSILIQCY